MNYYYLTQCYPYVLQRQRVCPFFKKRSECDSSAKVLVGEVQVALVHAIITFLIPEYQLSRENNETQTETPSPAIMGL